MLGAMMPIDLGFTLPVCDSAVVVCFLAQLLLLILVDYKRDQGLRRVL